MSENIPLGNKAHCEHGVELNHSCKHCVTMSIEKITKDLTTGEDDEKQN